MVWELHLSGSSWTYNGHVIMSVLDRTLGSLSTTLPRPEGRERMIQWNVKQSVERLLNQVVCTSNLGEQQRV